MLFPAELSLDRLPVLVTAANELIPHRQFRFSAAPVLLPGSFNPLHAGHSQLAAAAQKLLACEVHFELSIANVDKPELNLDEIRRRITQFAGRGGVWLT